MPSFLTLSAIAAALVSHTSYAIPFAAADGTSPSSPIVPVDGRSSPYLQDPQACAKVDPMKNPTNHGDIIIEGPIKIEITRVAPIKNRQNLCSLLAAVGQDAQTKMAAGATNLPQTYQNAFPPYGPGPIPDDSVSMYMTSYSRSKPATYLTLFNIVLGLIRWEIDDGNAMTIKFKITEDSICKAQGRISQGLEIASEGFEDDPSCLVTTI